MQWNWILGGVGSFISIIFLSLMWVFPNPKTFGVRYRYLTGSLSILIVQVIISLIPGFELNGYASPLV